MPAHQYRVLYTINYQFEVFVWADDAEDARQRVESMSESHIMEDNLCQRCDSGVDSVEIVEGD